MRRSRRLIILLCVLALAAAATFAVSRYQEEQELISQSGEVVLEIPTDSVDSLSWEYEDNSLSFHRDDGWIYDGDEAFPVDGDKIEELLEPFAAMSAAFIIEEVEDLGQYGLDDPLCTIEIATGDGEYTILVGDYSALDYQRYISTGDGNVYLVADDPIEYYDAVLDDLMKHDEIPSFGGASKVEFSGDENYAIERDESGENTYREDDVYFTEVNGQIEPLDSSRVDTYLQLISTLELSDYATYNATDSELETYGLDEPELSVSIEYPVLDEEGEETGESEIFNISFSRAAADKSSPWDEEEEEDDGSSGTEETSEPSDEDAVAYLRVGDSQIIYVITYDTFKDLMSASYDDFRHTEVFPAEFDDVSAIYVTLEGNEYAITTWIEENEDEGQEESGTAAAGETEGEERVFYLDGEELDISGLESALTALSAISFTDEQPGDTLEIALTVMLDVEGSPQIDIELYRVDGENCLAVVDGESVSLVPRSSVVDLVEAVNAIVLS